MPESDRPPRGGPHRLIATVALAAAHTVLFAAAYPGLGLWPLTFVSVIPLAWLSIRAASTRRAVLSVLVAQLLMWLWIQRWLIGVTAVGYPFLCAYLSLYPALFVWLLRRLSIHPKLGRVPATLLVPVTWVAVEFLRGEIVLHGYPWFLAAHPAVQWTVLVQSADLFGAYFVSFLVTMIGGAAIDLLRAATGIVPGRRIAAPVAAAAALAVANAAYGAWRLGAEAPISAGPTVLAIQTDVPQSNKLGWTPQQQIEDLARLIQLTGEALAEGPRADLVVWPETMLPGFGLEPETIRTLVDGGYFPGDDFSGAVRQLARNADVPLLVGSATYLGLRPVEGQWQWDHHYNSAYLVSGDPPFQRYDKHFLTPFGETMPYISAWPWLERQMLAVGAAGMRFDLDAAPGIQRLELAWSRPLVLATPICFEDTVDHVCRKMIYHGGDAKADVLINLSNDGWFGGNDAGRAQHAQIARFRCIENRVPMLRAVNTGNSVAIDSAGRITGAVGAGAYGRPRRPGWLGSELRLDARSTLYGRIGDVWGWACLGAATGLGAWSMIGRRQEATS